MFVCAFAPDEGETLGVAAWRTRPRASCSAAMQFRDDGTSVLDADVVADAFYADCDPVDVDRAAGLLRPQPMAAVVQPPRAGGMAIEAGDLRRVRRRPRRPAAVPAGMAAASPTRRSSSCPSRRTRRSSPSPRTLVDLLAGAAHEGPRRLRARRAHADARRRPPRRARRRPRGPPLRLAVAVRAASPASAPTR